MEISSLRKKTYIALLWSFIDRAGEQIIRFVFSIVLARLLLPEHFGIIGMAYVVIEIARIFVQGGFGYALINKTNHTKQDECSVFYFNIFVGVILSGTTCFLAPFIGKYFNNSILIPIVRLLSIDLLISSFGMIQVVLLTKKINFKSQTKISLPATFLSGLVGIIFALNNYGIWSLVIQTLLRTCLSTILLWIVNPWRPSRSFSFKSLSSFFKFGSKLLIGNISQVIFNNIYTIIIGKCFSPAQLGYFTRAQQTQQLPVDTFSYIIWRVAYPVLSSIKNDQQRLINALSKTSSTISLVFFPSIIIGSILAPGLFLIFFGARWNPSVIMFQILFLGSIFSPLEQIRNNAITSFGKPGIQLLLQTIKYVSIFASILLLYKNGIKYMLIGFGIVSYGNFILNSYFVHRIIGYSFLKQCIDFAPLLCCSLFAGVGAYLSKSLMESNLILSLFIQLTIFMVLYLSCCHIFKIQVYVENKKIINSYLQKIIRLKNN